MQVSHTWELGTCSVIVEMGSDVVRLLIRQQKVHLRLLHGPKEATALGQNRTRCHIEKGKHTTY